jgi:hypothetical protein
VAVPYHARRCSRGWDRWASRRRRRRPLRNSARLRELQLRSPAAASRPAASFAALRPLLLLRRGTATYDVMLPSQEGLRGRTYIYNMNVNTGGHRTPHNLVVRSYSSNLARAHPENFCLHQRNVTVPASVPHNPRKYCRYAHYIIRMVMVMVCIGGERPSRGERRAGPGSALGRWSRGLRPRDRDRWRRRLERARERRGAAAAPAAGGVRDRRRDRERRRAGAAALTRGDGDVVRNPVGVGGSSEPDAGSGTGEPPVKTKRTRIDSRGTPD